MNRYRDMRTREVIRRRLGGSIFTEQLFPVLVKADEDNDRGSDEPEEKHQLHHADYEVCQHHSQIVTQLRSASRLECITLAPVCAETGRRGELRSFPPVCWSYLFPSPVRCRRGAASSPGSGWFRCCGLFCRSMWPISAIRCARHFSSRTFAAFSGTWATATGSTTRC